MVFISENSKKSVIKRKNWIYSEKLTENSLAHLKKICDQLLIDHSIWNFKEWSEIIMGLVVQIADSVCTAVEIGGSNDLSQYIKVKIIPYGSLENTRYLNGIAFSKVFANKNTNQTIKDVKIMILSFPLTYDKSENHYVSLNKSIEQEKKYISKLISRILSLKPNLLLLEKGISNLALNELSNKNVAVITDIKKESLRKIAYLTGADIVTTLDKLALGPISGSCGNMYTQSFKSEEMQCGVENLIFLDNCNPERGGTIILRGGSKLDLLPVKNVIRMLLSMTHGLASEQALLNNQFGIFSSNLSKKKEPLSFKTMEYLEANKVIQAYSQKILTTFPYSRLKYPPELVRMIEAENKLKILNDRYTHLNLGFDEITGSTLLVAPSVPVELQGALPHNSLKYYKDSDGSRTYLSYLREAAPLEEIINYGNDFIKNNQVPPSLWENQSIVITCVVKQNKEIHLDRQRFCVPPTIHTIEFYCLNDITLGQYLQLMCFNLDLDCPSDNPCNEPMYHHTLTYISGESSVEVSMSEYPCPVSGMSEIVLMWAECDRCSSKTPYAPLSYESWYVSFGKYLDMFFSAENIIPRASICKHKLYLDFTHWFAYRNMSVKITRQSLKVYDIVPPSLPLSFEIDTNIKIKNEEFSKLSEKLHDFFDSLLSLVKDFPSSDVPTLLLRQFQSSVDNLNQRVMSEKSYFVKFLNQTVSSTHPADTLSLVRVYERLQTKVIEWDYLISEFYGRFLKQKDSGLASYLGIANRNQSFMVQKTENSGLGVVISRSNTNPSPFESHYIEPGNLLNFNNRASHVKGNRIFNDGEISFPSHSQSNSDLFNQENLNAPLLGSSPTKETKDSEYNQSVDLTSYKKRSHIRRLSIELIKEERRIEGLTKITSNRKVKNPQVISASQGLTRFLAKKKCRIDRLANVLERRSIESGIPKDFSLKNTPIRGYKRFPINKSTSQLRSILSPLSSPRSLNFDQVQAIEKSKLTRVNRDDKMLVSENVDDAKIEPKMYIKNSDFSSSEPSRAHNSPRLAPKVRPTNSNFANKNFSKKSTRPPHPNLSRKKISINSDLGKDLQPNSRLSLKASRFRDSITSNDFSSNMETAKGSTSRILALDRNPSAIPTPTRRELVNNKNFNGRMGAFKNSDILSNSSKKTRNSNEDNQNSKTHIKGILGLQNRASQKNKLGFQNIVDIFPQRRGILLSSSIQNINLHSQTLNMPNIKVFSTRSGVTNRNNTKSKHIENGPMIRNLGKNNLTKGKLANSNLALNPRSSIENSTSGNKAISSSINPAHSNNIGNSQNYSISNNISTRNFSNTKPKIAPKGLQINTPNKNFQSVTPIKPKRLGQINNIPLRSSRQRQAEGLKLSGTKNSTNINSQLITRKKIPDINQDKNHINEKTRLSGSLTNNRGIIADIGKKIARNQIGSDGTFNIASSSKYKDKFGEATLKNYKTDKNTTSHKGFENINETDSNSELESGSNSDEEDYAAYYDCIRHLFITEDDPLLPRNSAEISSHKSKKSELPDLQSQKSLHFSSNINSPFRALKLSNATKSESNSTKSSDSNIINTIQSKLKPLHSTWSNIKSTLFGFNKKQSVNKPEIQKTPNYRRDKESNYNEIVSHSKILEERPLFKDMPLVSNVPVPKSPRNIRNGLALGVGHKLKMHKRHFSDYSNISSSYPKIGFVNKQSLFNYNSDKASESSEPDENAPNRVIKILSKFNKAETSRKLSTSLGNANELNSFLNRRSLLKSSYLNGKNVVNASNLNTASFISESSDSSLSFKLSKESSFDMFNDDFSDLELDYKALNRRSSLIIEDILKNKLAGEAVSKNRFYNTNTSQPSTPGLSDSSSSSASEHNWYNLHASDSEPIISNSRHNFRSLYESDYNGTNRESFQNSYRLNKEIYRNSDLYKKSKSLSIKSKHKRKNSSDAEGSLYPVIGSRKYSGSFPNDGADFINPESYKSISQVLPGELENKKTRGSIFSSQTKKNITTGSIMSINDQADLDIFPNSQAQSPTVPNIFEKEKGKLGHSGEENSKTENNSKGHPRARRHDKHKNKDSKLLKGHASHSNHRFSNKDEKSGQFWRNLLGLLQLSENNSLYNIGLRIKYPLLPTDHVIKGCRIIIRETEPSSIVAFILASQNYQTQLFKLYSDYKRYGTNSEDELFNYDPQNDLESYLENDHESDIEESGSNSFGGIEEVKILSNKEIWNLDEEQIDAAFVNLPNHHLEFGFVSGQTRFGIKLYYIAQFEALRQVNLCVGENRARHF
ncbi:1-phosphatidylinositol 3-phosphate 5-kinase FAB1 [Smittium culicis]|uniref:1-phosphatidylinositol 3-phosphate 5-kinase FAB1 n=1 Tax=Smittium culicis TaxID=133412 RepID=A0A1R1YEP8_9FUNG|nr:1-phosphatidylinositol 3-phosphate 5-kinase FAB1 [Smittium culicis]